MIQELVQTRLIKATICTETKVISVTTLDEKDATFDNLKESLGFLSSILAAYMKNKVRVTWCWDLTSLSSKCVTKEMLAYIRLFFHELRVILRDTIIASTLVFSSKELSNIINTIIELIPRLRPCRTFNTVDDAVVWLKDVPLNG